MPTSRARTAICSAPLECPSSPGLPTRIFSRAAQALAERGDLVAQRGDVLARRRRARRLADARRRAVGAERVAQRLRPLAGRRARAGGGDRGGHDVLVARARRARARRARRAPRRRRAPRATPRAPRRCSASTARIDDEDPALGVLRERRRLGLHEAVHADEHLLARLDPRDPLAVRARRAPPSCTAPPRPRRRARRRAPSPRGRPRRSSATSPSITVEPSKMSGYSSRSVS